jgi:hypothetical protein
MKASIMTSLFDWKIIRPLTAKGLVDQRVRGCCSRLGRGCCSRLDPESRNAEAAEKRDAGRDESLSTMIPEKEIN